VNADISIIKYADSVNSKFIGEYTGWMPRAAGDAPHNANVWVAGYPLDKGGDSLEYSHLSSEPHIYTVGTCMHVHADTTLINLPEANRELAWLLFVRLFVH
jgi:hypothetical protein